MAAILLACAPAFAASAFAPGSHCLATDARDQGFAVLANDPAEWKCDPDDWSARPAHVILRIDLTGQDMAGADALTMRISRFQRMVLTLQDAQGRTASVAYRSADLTLATYDWLMTAKLPKLSGGHPTVLWVEVDNPRDTDMLTDVRIEHAGQPDAELVDFEVLVAALCGVLLIPFIYNIAFYRVLRESFLLWHAAVVACLFTHIATSSGLINRFFPLTVDLSSTLSVSSWSAGIVAASHFIVTLVEKGKLDPWHTRLAHFLSAMIIVSTAFFLFAGGPLRAFSTPVYVAMFFPVLAAFALMMATALKRGSRAIRFQILAWTPIMLVGIVRASSNLGVYGSPMSMMVTQHIAITIEVIVTSIGVADRFMTIKRQRDSAMAETRTLELELQHDALTGLLNRRAVGPRFANLHALGFDTMALIDLDHFKLVNDTHGHTRGDEVLRAAAIALAPDEDTLAVRMGGEEFLLLLRGPDAVQRAERRRQAITTRIASAVPGLDRPVTASMGLVEQPVASRIKADFSALYAHCDRLLYEAKRAGRNCTMRERVTRFDPKATPRIAAAGR